MRAVSNLLSLPWARPESPRHTPQQKTCCISALVFMSTSKVEITQDQSGRPGQKNEKGLRNLHLQKQQEGAYGETGGGNVDDGSPSQHEHRAGDGAGGRGGDAADEGRELGILSVLPEVRRQDDHAQIGGREGAEGGGAGAP